MEEAFAHIGSPIGVLRITGSAEGVTGVTFLDGWDEHRGCLREKCALPVPLRECVEEMREYFRGERSLFPSLRLLFRGTEFQCRVWDAARGIPCGEQATYGEVAAAIGLPGAAQAVGTALHCNLFAVAVPCHRVVSSDGEEGGYAWGEWRKRWLLRHEGAGVARGKGVAGSRIRRISFR